MSFVEIYMSLMVVSWQFKIILHIQLIKTFWIATLINIFNLRGYLECFNWSCVQSCFWLSTYHH